MGQFFNPNPNDVIDLLDENPGDLSGPDRGQEDGIPIPSDLDQPDDHLGEKLARNTPSVRVPRRNFTEPRSQSVSGSGLRNSLTRPRPQSPQSLLHSQSSQFSFPPFTTTPGYRPSRPQGREDSSHGIPDSQVGSGPPDSEGTTRPSGGRIRELASHKRNTFVGSRNCDYTCERNGGCKVTYVGPPRAGRTQVRLS